MWPAVIPILAYASIATQEAQLSTKWTMIVASFVLWAGLVSYSTYRLFRRVQRIRNLRLGYECELAVGQELDLLMLNGFRIFHDVPAEGFNIDHLVVGPTGVFAVETKGKSKVAVELGPNKKQFRVRYENDILRFPNHLDRTSVPQAIRQAQWASNWLSASTGSRTYVLPVLVLPGWFIENADKPKVPVIASGYIGGFFSKAVGGKIAPDHLQRIVYQVEQKVRDLPPGELVRPLPMK